MQIFLWIFWIPLTANGLTINDIKENKTNTISNVVLANVSQSESSNASVFELDDNENSEPTAEYQITEIRSEESTISNMNLRINMPKKKIPSIFNR